MTNLKILLVGEASCNKDGPFLSFKDLFEKFRRKPALKPNNKLYYVSWHMGSAVIHNPNTASDTRILEEHVIAELLDK